MASALISQLASAATEAETLMADSFTFKGANYVGVLGAAPISMTLAGNGYAETAQAVLQASLSQFSTAPNTADAKARQTINMANGSSWRVVSVENDGLHIKFGVTLAL